ncbi:MAG: hypothetical protein ACRDRJ_51060, partial [Streptosporangiaceae bacterium]
APESAPAEPGAAGAACAPVAGPTVMSVLRTERILQIGLLVTVAANLGSGGVDEVALPSLAHGPLHSGAVGYGWLIAAFGAGALAGTLVAGQAGRARRPFVVGSLAFLAEAACIAVAPFLGSTAAVAAAIFGLGVMNGFGNVLTITAFQKWAPADLLGRLSGVLMLASLGVFPISVALAALFVRHLGPASFFLFSAATLTVAILAGLSQRTWRDFGIEAPAGAAQPDINRTAGAPAAANPAGGPS